MALEAQLKWTDGLQFVGRAGHGPGLVIDNPQNGTGPGPMEMVLMGVAGCTAMDVVSIMKKKRVNLTHFQVNVSGEQASEHPKRYTNIHLEYVLHGKGIKPKDVELAIELSKTKYCSAMASLNAVFEHTYRIVESET